MGDLLFIGNLLEIDLEKYADKHQWFASRDEIRELLGARLSKQTTEHWLNLLQSKGVWCGKVLNYTDLDSQAFVSELQLKQTVKNSVGETLITTRSPIQLDGEILASSKAAPKVGEDNLQIHEQFLNE